LIILDSLGKPELSKQVGRLAILDAKKAVSKLFLDKTRKYFIFDEFNVYASDVAIDLLNKSRSANITCIPAFQSLSDLDKAGGVALRNQVIENCNNYIIMRQNSYDSSAEWEKVVGKEETTNYSYSIEEKASLFGNKTISNGNGSMHKTMENKHTYTDIQNLETGQSIFISKDQRIDKKIKMRSIKIDELHLEKKEHIKLKPKEPININPIKNIELDQDQNTFDDIEEMLSKFK
ncbi:MAG TPA: TraM recognition domain-containing protein, partial [Candidatus Paceibacterota bacterium]